MNSIQIVEKVVVLDELEIFDEWDINSLVNFVVGHHHYHRKQDIITIYDLAQQVSGKHGERHPELAKLAVALFLFFDDLLFHFRKEEQILFPNIIQLIEKRALAGSIAYTTFGAIEELAAALRKEHRAAVEELKFFRRLTNNYAIPADACTSYKCLFEKMQDFERHLILHIRLENDILFPKAIRMDGQLTEPG